MHLIASGPRRFAMAIFAVTIGLTLQNALAPTALAQSSTLTGTIIDKKTGRPLPEASIRVEGASTGVLSNSRGQFTLTGVSGRVRLAITHIGYLAGRADAEVGGAPIRVELVELVVKLDELVVTGTPGEAQQRSLGNVIGRVDVANNVVIAPPAKLQDLLAVNVPGVSILRSSGAIGAGGTTRIRGAGSLSLANDPLIYIDGVRVNNTANAASQVGARSGATGRSQIRARVSAAVVSLLPFLSDRSGALASRRALSTRTA